MLWKKSDLAFEQSLFFPSPSYHLSHDRNLSGSRKFVENIIKYGFLIRAISLEHNHGKERKIVALKIIAILLPWCHNVEVMRK
jgi:hypothetical protein